LERHQPSPLPFGRSAIAYPAVVLSCSAPGGLTGARWVCRAPVC